MGKIFKYTANSVQVKKPKNKRIAKPKKARITKGTVRAIVKREINKNLERKYMHESIQTANVADISAYYSNTAILDCSKGTGENARIGETVSVKTLKMRYLLQLGDTTNIVRIMIVREYQSSVDASSVIIPLIPQDVLEASGNIPDSLTSTYSINNGGRYQILYDKVHLLTNDYRPEVYEILTIPLNFKLHYNPDDSSTKPITNQIYLFAFSDSSSTSHPQLSFISQVDYVDS